MKMNECNRVRKHCVRTLQECATWEIKAQYQKIKDGDHLCRFVRAVYMKRKNNAKTNY